MLRLMTADKFICRTYKENNRLKHFEFQSFSVVNDLVGAPTLPIF